MYTSPSVIGGSSSSVEATHSRGLFLLCSKMSASQYSSFFFWYTGVVAFQHLEDGQFFSGLKLPLCMSHACCIFCCIWIIQYH